MPQPKYLILWNPSARSAEVSIDLRNQLEANPDVDLRITACAGEAEQLVEEAAEHEDGVVVAAGGDGTIHVVINTVCTGDRRPILSCLPLGTGNDLCRTLGIPLDLVEAADLVLNQPHPPIRAIDLVRAESQAGIIRFANVCSGGNSQRVSECLDEETKRRWGAWSYLRGAVEVLNDLEGFEVGLRFDRGPRETMRSMNSRARRHGRATAVTTCRSNTTLVARSDTAARKSPFFRLVGCFFQFVGGFFSRVLHFFSSLFNRASVRGFTPGQPGDPKGRRHA